MKKIVLSFICSLLCVIAYAQANFDDVYKAAMQGNTEAQVYLGWMYATGNGVSKNESEGFKWMLKAAQQNFVEAQRDLGKMYFWGTGVSKDVSEAFKWSMQQIGATGI